MTAARFALWLALSLGPCQGISATPAPWGLRFVASYQGMLSAGATLDIATLNLNMASLDPEGSRLEASLAGSTAGYSTAETLFPTRFCSWSTMNGSAEATLEARWRGHVNGRLAQGELRFDPATRQVLRHQLERKERFQAALQEAPLSGKAPSALEGRDQEERSATPYPPGAANAMDRVTMLVWLRRQTLAPGVEFQPVVLNGRQLLGYRIQVEGEDTLPWQGMSQTTWRLRLDPLVNDDSKRRPIWLWIGQDEARLPLRMRGAGVLGSFELRLVGLEADSAADCPAVHGPGS